MAKSNDYAAVKRRFESACDAEGLARSRIEVGSNRPGLAVVDIAGAHTKKLLLTAGIHGDEPAGVEAALRFLESKGWEAYPDISFTVLPCLNPYGFAAGTRENVDGVDVNRSFRGEGTPESRALRAFLNGIRFDLFYDMHEDVDQTGFYLYELHDGTTWGEQIVAAVAARGPIAADGDVEGLEVRSGIIRPEALDLRLEQQDDWPMVFHLVKNGLPRGITPETPGKLPFEQRVQMHLAGLEATLSLIAAGSEAAVH